MLSVIGQYVTPTVIKWGVIILTAFGVYFYISHLRAENNRLIQDNASLKNAVKMQEETIKGLQEDHTKIIKSKDQLNEKVVELQKEKVDLIDKLNRESKNKKSIEELARKKTKLVEKAVNNGTAKALECFELLSENKECN